MACPSRTFGDAPPLLPRCYTRCYPIDGRFGRVYDYHTNFGDLINLRRVSKEGPCLPPDSKRRSDASL